MSEDLNKELLKELKEINHKLDAINSSSRGLSGSLKLIAVIFGFVVVGPLLIGIIGFLLNFSIN